MNVADEGLRRKIGASNCSDTWTQSVLRIVHAVSKRLCEMGCTLDQKVFVRAAIVIAFDCTVVAAPIGLSVRGVVSPTNNEAVVVSGNLNYSVYQGERTPLFNANYQFDAKYTESIWEFKYTDLSSLTNADILNQTTTACSDGTNIYIVTFQNTNTVNKVWGSTFASTHSNLPSAMVTIYEGTYPPPREPILLQLWLAFGSQCLLTNESGLAKPPFQVDMGIFSREEYSCSYKWNRFGDTNTRTLILESDGVIWDREATTGQILRMPLGTTYQKPYILGRGVWNQLENTIGMSVPRDYEFAAYLPVSANADTNQESGIAYITRIVVTNTTTNAELEVPPKLPNSKVIVEDRRFGSQGYASVSYTVTNLWLATDDEKLKKMLKSRTPESLEGEALRNLGLRTIEGFPVKSPERRRAILAVLGLLVVLIGFFLVYPGIKKQTQQKG